MKVNLISAIGTPLTPDETVHVEGLECLLSAQWKAGMSGVLIAGTMGLLQLLRDQSYTSLIDHCVKFCSGRGEVLVGVGDAGFGRTADRIRYVNRHDVDGVVVLPPYLIQFRQEELCDYYRALADVSKAPLFLYDLPSLTGVKLDIATVVELSRHPNIAGIKCSGDLNDALELISGVAGSFRVIVAQADHVDALCQQGIVNHLDGVFSLAPEWAREIGDAAESGNWIAAAAAQRLLSGVLGLLHQFGVFPAYNEMMHLRGIPGLFAPRPFRLLEETQRQSLTNSPLIESLRMVSQNGRRAEATNRDGERAFKSRVTDTFRSDKKVRTT